MTNFLQHYGVLGMKWGRRKTPTSRDYSKVARLKKKKIRSLSNDELRIINTRKQLEKTFKELNPSKTARGARAVSNVLKTIGKVTAGAATVTTAVAAGKKLYDTVQKVKT